MTKEIIKRVIDEADYMILTNKTIREVAKKFYVSKSTVHKDLQERLKALNEYMKTTNADEISAKEKMDDIARKIVYSIDYKKSMQETLEK